MAREVKVFCQYYDISPRAFHAEKNSLSQVNVAFASTSAEIALKF